MLYAMFNADHPQAGRARDAFRKLFPLEVGKSVRFSTTGQTSAEGWLYTFSYLGIDRLITLAGTFDVHKVMRREEGIGPNIFLGEQTLYFNSDWIVVKLDSQIIRGNAGYSNPWEAVLLRVP